MRIYFILFLFFAYVNVWAQDQLFKKDNTKLEVKVTEITPTEIKYKLFKNPDGPLYIVPKSDVALIIYQNGEHEAFKDTPIQEVSGTPVAHSYPSIMDSTVKTRERDFMNMTRTKNVLFVNCLQLLNSCIGGSYFREFFGGVMDIEVPAAFSFGQPMLSNQLLNLSIPNGVRSNTVTSKNFDLGFGIYVNTSGKRSITHFIGLLYRYERLSGQCTIGPISSYGGSTTSAGVYNFTLDQQHIMINNGFLYRMHPHFNLMINFALGLMPERGYHTDHPLVGTYVYSGSTVPLSVQFGVSAGYRF